MKREVMIWTIALCAVALPPLAAQQGAGPPPAAGASAAPVAPARTALPGPRLQPEYRRFEPGVTDSSANLMSGGSHTFVISTLALVLIVVIIVLLVVK
jgi:hypothetical protein